MVITVILRFVVCVCSLRAGRGSNNKCKNCVADVDTCADGTDVPAVPVAHHAEVAGDVRGAAGGGA